MSEITNVSGLAELDRMLKELPARLEANVVRGGLRAAATVIRDEAKQLVPIKSGELRKSIRISTAITKGTSYARVKAGSAKAVYAHMVEFGTVAHRITAKKGGFLNINGRLVRSVNHPGAVGKPFMRPAFDARKDAALDTMKEYLAERIPREIDKMRK